MIICNDVLNGIIDCIYYPDWNRCSHILAASRSKEEKAQSANTKAKTRSEWPMQVEFA